MHIFIDQAAVGSADGEYLWQDLVGCAVIGDDGASLGSVTGLQDYGAQDILIVAGPRGEWLLPFVEDVIADVDLASRHIVVHLPEGMDACFTPKS